IRLARRLLTAPRPRRPGGGDRPSHESSTRSTMRIIAGKAGRLAIKVPSAVARPTTDFVRQAIFSILAERVVDARVLDLFAGSGALGLEALSRGARSCVFVDEHRQAATVIAENLKRARLEGGRVVRSEAATFLKRDAA